MQCHILPQIGRTARSPTHSPGNQGMVLTIPLFLRRNRESEAFIRSLPCHTISHTEARALAGDRPALHQHVCAQARRWLPSTWALPLAAHSIPLGVPAKTRRPAQGWSRAQSQSPVGMLAQSQCVPTESSPVPGAMPPSCLGGQDL